MNELIEIQRKLKVGKNEKNGFGNYKYRTCEGILEAVKPLMGDCGLILEDEIVLIGDRYYVKAKALFKSSNGDMSSSTGYARECQTKKGMDEAQITGAASSYARKYALCGLFLIDGGGDPDGNDNTKEGKKKKKKEPLNIEQEIIGRINKFFDEELPGAKDEALAVTEKYRQIDNFNYSTPEIKDNIIKHFNDRTELYMDKEEGK